MAGEKIVGKINELQGDGVVLIIRASGERIIAKAGDAIFAGDTIVTSGSSSVIIDVNVNGSSAAVQISSGEFARFDSVLFDQFSSLFAGSSANAPINVGNKVTPDLSIVLNETIPNSGITTDTETNIDSNPVEPGLFSGETSTLPSGRRPEEIPSDDFNSSFYGNTTNNTNNQNPETIPGAGANQNSGSFDETLPSTGALAESIPDTSGNQPPGGIAEQELNTLVDMTAIPVDPVSGSPSDPSPVVRTIVVDDEAVIDEPVAEAPIPQINTVPTAQNVAEDADLTFSAATSNQISVNDATAVSTQLNVNNGVLFITLSGSATISAGANNSGALTVSGTQTDINASLASVTYSGDADFNGADVLTVVSTNAGGMIDSDTVEITVAPVSDGTPDAMDDSFSTPVDTVLNGNLITNDAIVDQADVDPVTAVATALGGTITIAADGSFSYTPPAGQTGVTDTYTYTLRDSDGEIDTANFSVALGGPVVTIPNDDTVGENNDDLLVVENSTANGSFTITSANGVASVQIGGTTIALATLNAATAGAPVDITGETLGTLQVTDYNSTTGVVTYTYDPTDSAQDHSGATNDVLGESLAVVVTDSIAQTTTATLNIGITDTAPVANDDQRSISEGTSAIAGNAFGIAGSATGDVQDGVLVDQNATPITAGTFAGNFGSLSMSNSGVYTYTLDNTSTDVQGLKGGESATDVFTYTITDGDGSTDTASLTVTVNGVEDALPTVTISAANSVTDGSGNTVNGSFTAQADAGLVSVTLAGSGAAQNISSATTANASSHVTLTGVDGDLVVTNFNTATGVVTYNYTENGSTGAVTVDNFSIVAVDNEGDSQTDTLSITINDAPIITIPDNNGVSTGDESVVENATINSAFTVSTSAGLQSTGTALSLTVDGTTTNLTLAQLNSLGAVPVVITDGDDGNLTLTSFNSTSGVVNYTFDPTGTSRDHSGGDESVSEQFSIVATDINSLTNSPSVLEILVTDTNPTANDDARSISEGTSAIAGNAVGIAGSATGDVQDTLVDSTGSSVIDIDFGGTDGTVGTGIAGDHGSFVISSSGVYTYTLDNTDPTVQGLKGGQSLVETFTYTLEDGDGDTDTANIAVTINGVEDALPTFTVPSNTVTDSSSNTVNGSFTAQADAGLVSVTLAGSGAAQNISGVTTANASSHVTLTGADGDLVVTNFNASTGIVSYNYTENGSLDAIAVDNFSIVAVDNEGDSGTGTLSITIDDFPVVIIPSSLGVGAVGDESIVENAGGAGLGATFTVSTSVGLQTTGTALSFTVDGTTTNLTLAQLNALGTTPVVITDGDDGDLTLQSFNSTSGVIAYTFDPTGTSRDHSGGDESVIEQYSIVATDSNGNTGTPQVLDILITDTNPTANDDGRSITEGTSAIAGNAVGFLGAATGDVQDNIADSTGSSVIDIDFGGTDGTVGTGLAGDHGSLIISSSGVYTYTLDNTSTDVQGLKGGQSLVETFTYTLEDSDGDTDTANIAVTINGVEDALPTVTIPDDNGGGLIGDRSVAENATMTGSFTVTASAGIEANTGFSITVDGATTNLTLAQLNALGATPVVITDGNDGDLTLTSYNSGTGVINYSFDPTGTNRDHSGGDTSVLENYTIVVTDNEGDTDTNSLDVLITDTAPTAAADNSSVTEDAFNIVTGDVMTNDTQSADTAVSVVGVDFGGAQTVGTPFSSDHGTLDLNADGTYTYTLDNGDSAVNALNSGESLVETFNYTITDTDGDTSTTTLTVTVSGADETVISSTTATDNETLTGTSANENFLPDTVLSVSDGATGAEIINGNGGSDRLIINGDDIPMVAANGDNEGGGFQRIEIQGFTLTNTASNAEGDVIDISDLLDTAGADINTDNTITAAEATPFIHISENEGSTTGGVISIDVGGGFNDADRAAINSGGTVTGQGTGDRDLVISSNDASADLDTAAAAGGYTGPAYSPVEADQTAQIQALVDQNILVIDT